MGTDCDSDCVLKTLKNGIKNTLKSIVYCTAILTSLTAIKAMGNFHIS